MPRQKGSITCQQAESAVAPSCGKMARVRVMILMKNAQGGYSEISILRCWKHYATLENAARKSTTVKVIRAEVI